MSRHRCRAPEPAPPAASRVEITLGTHQVVIETTETMQVTIAAALQLWRDTIGGDERVTDQIGFSNTMVTDPAAPQPLMGPEICLPHRLIPQQDTPEDRRE